LGQGISALSKLAFPERCLLSKNIVPRRCKCTRGSILKTIRPSPPSRSPPFIGNMAQVCPKSHQDTDTKSVSCAPGLPTGASLAFNGNESSAGIFGWVTRDRVRRNPKSPFGCPTSEHSLIDVYYIRLPAGRTRPRGLKRLVGHVVHLYLPT